MKFVKRVAWRCRPSVNRRARVHDAFVDVGTVRYSVPYRLVRDHVDVVVEKQIVRIVHGATVDRDPCPVARALR